MTHDVRASQCSDFENVKVTAETEMGSFRIYVVRLVIHGWCGETYTLTAASIQLEKYICVNASMRVNVTFEHSCQADTSGQLLNRDND